MKAATRWGWALVAAFGVLSSVASSWGEAAISISGVSIVAPADPAQVPRYTKVELQVALSGVVATKPYNPDPAAGGLDLSAAFTGPSGAWSIKGFYDGANWRVRFAPDATGSWTFSVTATDGSGTSSWTGGSFTCVASASPGWARIDGRFLRLANGQVVFPVGHNTGWQPDVEQPTLSAMAAKGENLLSFWLAMPWAHPSWGSYYDDRAPIENIEGGVGNYNQAACAYLDGVVERAEAAGVFLLPTLWSHGQLRDVGHSWGTGWWDNNAYNTLCSATDFFKTTNGGDTPQWRCQKNFYRYLIARWGHSRAVAGWVAICEIDGTTGWVANQSQATAWCSSVRDYFRANDPFRRNASGKSPLAGTKLNAASWEAGFDLRSTDNYAQQGNNVAVAAAIASDTQTFWSSAKPGFHAEFGGNTSGGATQPTHLHNGIWAGAATGAAMTPLVWCDGGSFPMLSGAMQDHLQYLAQFMAGLNYFGDPALAKATLTIASPCRGWGMKLADRGYAWVQNTAGTMGGQALTISGLTQGSYSVAWYDAWTNGAAPFQTSSVTVGGNGSLTAAVPTLARADIALKFWRIVNNAPVAVADAYTTNEDVALSVPAPGVLANDTDANGDPLTAVLVAGPSHGTLALASNGSFTYTPNPNYNGSDSFTYKANDGKADSNVAAVAISVAAVNDPPIAEGQSVTTPEDTALAITLSATDADGDPLTYSVVAGPAHGALTGTAPNLTYTPAANYSGPDSFTFKANDGKADSNVATVAISVAAVNDPPIAEGQSVTTPEDTPVAITLSATDVEGNPLTYSVVAGPAHGTLAGAAPILTYAPAADYNGTDTFTFKANDGQADSNVATVTITVSPVNDSPVANDDSATIDEDNPVVIPVLANDTDPDDDALTVTGVTQPAHGSASVSPDNTVIYSPDPNFSGSDSFTYSISDGHGGTASAIVTINVNAVNDPPVASDDAAATDEDIPVTIDVLANDTDIEGDALTVAQLTQPAHGIAFVETDNKVTYSPDPDFHGTDSFTYTASDGAGTDTATVTVTVNPVNDPPVANGQSVTTCQDTPVAVTLAASDVDGDALTYSIVTPPANGALSGDAPGLTYTPNAQYQGPDSFTFKANDGQADSNVATVSITVTPVNHAPVADGQAVTTNEDTPVAITLTASDPDGDPLTCAVVAGPSHGALSGTAPNLTYTPAANYNGPDSFTFKANDGQVDSNIAIVSITVTPVNDPPVANPQSVTTAEDTAVNITLTATDADGDPLTCAVVAGPSHGALSGTAPNLTYTPNPNYNGPDSFTFKANDGTVDSNEATVSITVTPVNDLPIANPQSVTTAEDTAVSITLTATDVDGDELTYSIVAGPAHGTLTGTAPSVTYTPAANYNGPDTFTFKANDGQADSDAATVSITVNSVNDPPVANPQSVATNQDTAVAITLTASDIESDPLTYSIVTPPAHGTLTGTAPNVTYTPAANYNGPESFTFKANDGQADSNVATVTITVNPASPTAVLSIAMSKTRYGSYWKATATVTVKDSAGNAIASATVSGHWSGVYSSGTVSATTGGGGKATFTSGSIRASGTATFTVDKVVKNGTTYILTGETSDSIAGP